ncbi:MAG: 3-oxoacyl-[acyl-carrier-protein] reductase [Elusimicrobia bacterium]|jgi:3-oxoacyl-[acyl-carrier protein] reductase|nr:3-oxoacyl-[acyl-carrier-protein] reductase [Elusimicrobiota bacterium]
MSNQKIAVVTGGAQGIGFAIAKKLANSGCKVIIVDIAEEISSAAAKKLNGDYKLVDVSKEAGVEKAVSEIIEKYDKIDILINNAGITRDGLLIRMKEEDFDSVIAINLKGVFNFSKQVVKKSMMKNRSGVIVNIASIVGIIGNPGQLNYSASKGGVITMTRTMAKELSGRNIRVNAVAPGFIETRMTDKLSDKVKESFLKNIPMNRLGKPEEVAAVVNFLVSQESDYITGQVINIDGGLVMA